MARVTESKLLTGWYRISGEEYFSNIKRERRGDEFAGKWTADLRQGKTGDLIEFAGVWDTKREAVEEVTRLITKREWQPEGCEA